jgi:hypothetical protein
MSLILVLSVQMAAVATPAAPAPPPASDPRWAMPAMTGADGSPTPLAFDLARYRSEGGGGCAGAGAADILVCGPRRSGGAYPLDHWARIFGPEPPIRAEMGLGGGATANIHAERHDFNDRGRSANRVMVGIKLPF